MIGNIASTHRGPYLVTLICAFVIAISLFFWVTSSVLISTWNNLGYQHGMLVPFVSLYLLWDIRHKLAKCAINASLFGAIALTLAILVWFVAQKSLIQLLEQLSLILIFTTAIWACFGSAILRTAAFPIGFLIFAIPIGAELVPTLVEITATLSTFTLQAVGYPLFREGAYLTLPSGTFHVAEACSGFKYLFSGITLSVLLAQFSFQSLTHKIYFIFASAIYYVLLNSVRAIIVIIVIHESNMTIFLGQDHIAFGWVLFGGAVLLQCWVASRLASRELSS